MGLTVAFPFFVLIHISALFVGREKAVAYWGPYASWMLTTIVEFVFIPKISHPEEFDTFTREIERNTKRFGYLYDITVTHHDSDTIALRFENCLHCAAFESLGFPDVNPHICQGDWDIARRNRDVWDFERDHQIGTGDAFCDHTYKRKVAE